MTRRRIANTDIKVIRCGYNYWEKGIFNKLVFTLKKVRFTFNVIPFGCNRWEKGIFKNICFYIEERNLIVKILREVYGLLFSGINLKR